MEQTQQVIEQCYNIYKEHVELINSYVLDFFVKNHWNNLSNCFKNNLNNLDENEIADLLDYDKPMNIRVWPLSLIALKRLLVTYSIPREKTQLQLDIPKLFENNSILKYFWRKVKNKKRHEINLMAQMCYKVAKETNCFYIVDVGSGVGHLSRMLHYGYNFKVCSIEAQEELSKKAEELDNDFEKYLLKLGVSQTESAKNRHISMRITPTITWQEFLTVVKKAFKIEENGNKFFFGIVGLHPCGDLGATLLKLYTNCPNIIFINLVGCCYMKLTTNDNDNLGFPLSKFCLNRNYDLSYESREIACHAIETYIDKLREGEIWKLKIHSYRALIEKYIVELYPALQRTSLANVAYTKNLSFQMYCMKALSRLNIFDEIKEIFDEDCNHNYLNQWKQVVVFYSLRLLFAPIIETIILLDRVLYVQESGSAVEITCLFDPRISPRAHILTAKKV